MGFSRNCCCYQRNWHITNIVVVLLSIILCYDQINIVSSFSSGAGSCVGDEPAVGGLHLDDENGNREVQGGPLAALTNIAIDGTPLVVNQTLTFPINTDLEITIESTGDFEFKGFLIRVQAPNGYDTSDVILPSDDLAQVAETCIAPIVGITHVDSNDKPIVSGIINFPEEADNVDFDITVVFLNGAQGSAYVYNRLTANFRQATRPITAPITAPIAPGSPIATPSAPIVTPSAPIAAPSAPIATPSAPVTRPSAPIATPTVPIAPGSPIATPTVPVATPSVPIVSPSSIPDIPSAPISPSQPTTPFPPIPPIPPIPIRPTRGSSSPSPTPHSIWPPILGKGKGKGKGKGSDPKESPGKGMMSMGKGGMMMSMGKGGMMMSMGKGGMMSKGKGMMSKGKGMPRPPKIPPPPPKYPDDDDYANDDLIVKFDIFRPKTLTTADSIERGDDYVEEFDMFHQ